VQSLPQCLPALGWHWLPAVACFCLASSSAWLLSYCIICVTSSPILNWVGLEGLE
jgi:hypothetical protein